MLAPKRVLDPCATLVGWPNSDVCCVLCPTPPKRLEDPCAAVVVEAPKRLEVCVVGVAELPNRLGLWVFPKRLVL